MKGSITIMVPAFEEEENIERAVKKYDSIARKIFHDYEILIFNDGSTDRTGAIADALSKRNPKIKVVHNGKNKGLGYNYRTAVGMSNKDYFIMFSGEGDALAESVRSILLSAGKADIIVPYISNNEVRPWIRRAISGTFTQTLNTLFGLDLKYYNGYVLHRTKMLKRVKMSTNSFAYQAEILVRLLCNGKGHSYLEVPYLTEKTIGSSCFRIKNLLGVGGTMVTLLFDVHLRKK